MALLVILDTMHACRMRYVCTYACMYVLSGGRYQIDAAGGEPREPLLLVVLADVALSISLMLDSL